MLYSSKKTNNESKINENNVLLGIIHLLFFASKTEKYLLIYEKVFSHKIGYSRFKRLFLKVKDELKEAKKMRVKKKRK